MGQPGWGSWWKAKGSDTVTHCSVWAKLCTPGKRHGDSFHFPHSPWDGRWGLRGSEWARAQPQTTQLKTGGEAQTSEMVELKWSHPDFEQRIPRLCASVSSSVHCGFVYFLRQHAFMKYLLKPGVGVECDQDRSRAHFHGTQSGGSVRQWTAKYMPSQMVINTIKKNKEAGGRADMLVRIIRESPSRQAIVE